MQKKGLKFLLVGILALAVVLAGCTKKTESEGAKTTNEPAKKLIGLSISTLNNPFFVSLADGAKKSAKTNDVELIVVDAGDDAAKQVADIEDLISKKVLVLIVNPVDSDAVSPVVQDALDAKIKVIAVDRAVNGAQVHCQIASDNVLGAKMATDYLVELVGEKAKVAELQGILGASATVDRGAGFHTVADKSLTIVASQTANFNRAEGLTVTENILQAHPDIAGIFAHNDEMALGAVEAISASKKDVVVIGFDATDDAVASVNAGIMAATVAQQPSLMGEKSVETALLLIDEHTVPASLPVDVRLVTK